MRKGLWKNVLLAVNGYIKQTTNVVKHRIACLFDILGTE